MIGFGKQQKEQYDLMVASITERVYNDVAKKLKEETEEKVKETNDKLLQRLDEWDTMVMQNVQQRIDKMLGEAVDRK